MVGGLSCSLQLQRFLKVSVLHLGLKSTGTPQVCGIMAFGTIFSGLGLLFYKLLGFQVGTTMAVKPNKKDPKGP